MAEHVDCAATGDEWLYGLVTTARIDAYPRDEGERRENHRISRAPPAPTDEENVRPHRQLTPSLTNALDPIFNNPPAARRSRRS